LGAVGEQTRRRWKDGKCPFDERNRRKVSAEKLIIEESALGLKKEGKTAMSVLDFDVNWERKRLEVSAEKLLVEPLSVHDCLMFEMFEMREVGLVKASVIDLSPDLITAVPRAYGRDGGT
jgi:hypothetical protein